MDNDSEKPWEKSCVVFEGLIALDEKGYHFISGLHSESQWYVNSE
jgi:hypothetical protein